MGQNFLTDSNVPEEIAEGAGIDTTFGVLEIGPGIGALTRSLTRRAKIVTAVELDKRLEPLLLETLEGADNVRIVSGDILKLDIAKTVVESMPGLRYAVCANLPYNITTPVLTALFKAEIFETITVMVQREVALRMCAKPGTSAYGAFTVFVRYYSQPEILFEVPPECFLPQPKVTSAVIRLKMNASRPVAPADAALFFRVVRASFAQRRKMLVNGLEASFGNKLSKDTLREIIVSCGYDEKIRGEMLDIPGFASIARAIGVRLQVKAGGDTK